MQKKQFEERRYQTRTVDNFKKWATTNGKLATIILPTGTGKSFVAASCIEALPNKKVLWVAHRRELINQADSTISQVVSWTDKIAKEIAKDKAPADSDIVIGSVQTLHKTRKNIKEFTPDLVVIDEYHHMSEDNKTYHGLYEKYPNAKFLGLTATPFRFAGDDLPLGEVLFEMDIGTAITHGYLVPLVPEVLKSNVSLANVKTRMGDFDVGELSRTINTEERNRLIVNKIKELVASGRQGVVFAADVQHSKDLCEMAKKDGLSCAEIYGETPTEERDNLIRLISEKKIDVTFNNLTMTEGTDIPHWSFAVMARPTRSLGLYIQGIGRVARKCDVINKQNAIIIDVYDKIKVKQSRITFKEAADHGDMFGDRKRANNILTADISWDEIKSKRGDSDTDNIAYILKHFPVFMINDAGDRWTTDDTSLPVTSWVIAEGQRLVTWTEERTAKKLSTPIEWVPLRVKPVLSLIKNNPIIVKHEEFGIGKIVDLGYGSEVKVEFGETSWKAGRYEFVNIESLLVRQQVAGVSSDVEKYKQDRIFYLCFPAGAKKGRVVEFIKEKKELVLVKDQRLTQQELNNYITDVARDANVWHLVKKDAKWKDGLISEAQKKLLQTMIDNGKIRFDIDLNALTKGDASAVIEQVKWQNIIRQKFGVSSKEKLLGYNQEQEDV